MNRGAARQPIFRSRVDGDRFEELIGIATERHRVELHAYCLMTNHFHLLLHAPDGDVARFMHLLQSTYSGWFNRKHERDGGLFRARYNARIVDSVEYRTIVGRYIHRNPLDVRPAVPLPDYPWSSLRYFVGREPSPPWLRTDVLLGSFTSRQTYGEFVGDDDAAFADARMLVGLIETVVAEHVPLEDRRRRETIRLVVAALLDRCTAAVRTDLLAWLALPSAGAERAIRSRARALLAGDPTFAAIVARVT